MPVPSSTRRIESPSSRNWASVGRVPEDPDDLERSWNGGAEPGHNFFREAVDRLRNGQALENSERLLESAINAMSAIVAILDQRGRIVMVNRAGQFVLRREGCNSHDVVGHEYLAPSNLSPRKQEATRFRAGLRSVINGSADSYRLTYRTSANSNRWFRMTASRFDTDGSRRTAVVHEDVSDLHIALQSVHDLSRQLVNVQEEERQRIACELHDSTSQHLTAVSLNMMSLREHLSDGAKANTLLDEIDRSVSEAQKEIRVFSYLLHPPYLERDGLKATLLRFIDGFTHRTALAADARIAHDVDYVPFALQHTVLRIVQESLANVHRHADATRVSVDLGVRQGLLVLHVIDNGRRIAPCREHQAPSSHATGVGLTGMEMRVRQFGGRFSIRIGSKGTHVGVRIPLLLNDKVQPDRE